MEMIHSTKSSYLIIRVVCQSHKCRVSIAQDSGGSAFVLNQIFDRKLIAAGISDFEEKLEDFVEFFSFRGDYFAVFRYRDGTPLLQAIGENDTEAVLSCCESIAMAAAATELPDEFLYQVLTFDCVVINDESAIFNKQLTFPDLNVVETTVVQKLAELLSGLIEEADLDIIQSSTLAPLKQTLKNPPDGVLELYLAVRDFRSGYTYMETIEMLKLQREKVVMAFTFVKDKVLFIVATAAIALAAVAAVLSAFRQPEPTEPYPELGSFLINERGSIYERVVSQGDETGSNTQADTD